MPICGRVVEHQLRRSTSGWQIALRIQPPRMRDHFLLQLKRNLPTTIEVRPDDQPTGIVIESDRPEHFRMAHAFVELLRVSLTIDDEATVSHALGLHWFADIEEFSAIGDLVRRGKDYGSTSPSESRAVEQLTQVGLHWLSLHPMTDSVEVVAAIPGTQPKSLDLPAEIAQAVCRKFGKQRVWLRTRNQRPQKGRSNSVASGIKSLSALMHADRSVFGRRVLLIDDLYRSGDTMMAGVRALRRAGAVAVYCLALTKTARDCNGLPASVDNWPDWLPETFSISDNDLPSL